MAIEGVGFLDRLVDWLLMGVVALGGIIFKGHDSRISKLEENSVTKETFTSSEARAEKSRGEVRQAILNLYTKVDEVKDLIIERTDKR
jgi:hypothetical protein